ncbi:hypothetical protein R1sor_011359 [Riccia sorocarpa]|uniref:Uncharacterized protein n=1 Tax=Riccia sorocarpa TaxID=122646 RepID=A0ABD3I115_9MARC
MVNELKGYLDEANKSLDHTRDKNCILSRENRWLEEQLSTIKIFGPQASAEKDAWENHEVQREQWLKQMKLHEEKWQSDKREMEQRIDDLTVIASVADRRQTKQAKKAELQELKSRSRQLETENRDLTQRYQAVQDKAERLREDIAVRAAKEEELKKRVAHLERESRLAATPIQAQAVTEESNVALEREEKLKEEQVKKQKADLDGKEAEWKQKISDLQKEKDTWETLAASLRLKAAELSADDVGGLRAEYDRLQRNVEVLEEKQADFISKFVKPAREEALRLAKHKHLMVHELDVAYRQTRMIHQDRWRDFALLGVASFAARHSPLPEVEDARRGSGEKDDQAVYDLTTYWSTVCHSFDIDHACTEVCEDLGSHICAACSNEETADCRYVSQSCFRCRWRSKKNCDWRNLKANK